VKILAVYPSLTLPLIRRVRAPFSVLAERGYAFHFLQADSFRGGLSHAYDVTVLSDWVLSDSEDFSSFQEALAHGRAIVCDLSDGRLLASKRMQEQLALASLVTVSTERLKKEVQNLVGTTKVVTLPSCVDVPYFASANRTPMPDRTRVGCFGPGDWRAVAPIIKAFHQKHPRYRFLGEPQVAEAMNAENGVEIVVPVDLHPENYPVVLHACSFGLLAPPLAQEPWGQDPIWQWEYGILARPTISLISPTTREGGGEGEHVNVHAHVKRIEHVSGDPDARVRAGQQAFGEAYLHRATVIADQYGRLYRKQFAHLF